MFKSKRSSQATISPLAPPPASTIYPNQQQQQHQQQYQAQSNRVDQRFHPQQQHPQQPGLQQSQQYPTQPGDGDSRLGPGGRMDGQRSSNAAPAFDELQRTGTNGTMDGSVSSKSEKRRSGFFGLGGKKDKNKDKQLPAPQEEQSRPSSFSIDRSSTQSALHPPLPPGNQRRPEPGFMAPAMSDRYPRPQQSPPIQGSAPFDPRLGGQPGPGQINPGGQRVASSPQPPPPSNGEFGSAAPQSFPKSQSMGFAPRAGQTPAQPPNSNQNVPDTHPYRGFLNAQQDRTSSTSSASSQGAVPRSASMPLDRANGNSTGPAGTPPTVEKETMDGSPSLNRISTPEGGVAPPWMKQFDVVVDLIAAQPQKTYVASPPELEMILARTSAGGQPKQGQPGSASNDWDSVWLQLSGISLSMWSMKETRAAAAKGEKVPPTYFNITDSSLETLAPLPPPPHRPNSHPHHFVFGLNTAGSNRLLFSCPSERDLAKWAIGLRLAAWERARLEEIYTGHLIKAGGREPKSELVKGRMEGWVRVRVMGGTDWKRLWLVISTPNAPEDKEDEKKSRRRSIFGFGDKEKEVVQEPNTGVSMASFYLEQRTPKNKTSVAVLTITDVSQAYAVFPERLEVMSQSNLMKVAGRVGGELVTIEGRVRESGWALIMPESSETAAASPSPQSPLSNMMRWVTGFHDVFALYGRPARYNWDPQDPKSLFFAYPHGPERARLFLDLEEALQCDFRISSLPTFRRQFTEITLRKMARPVEQYRASDDETPSPRPEGSYRLPPLQFGDASPALSHDSSQPRSLTPITERTDIASRNNSTRTAGSNFYMGERKVSDGPPTKQSSGGSSKHAQGASGNEERLAPISDSAETFGQFTEEPKADGDAPTTAPTTNESATAPSTWSQSSGQTPTPGAEKQLVFPVPATRHAAPPADITNRDVPALPPKSGNNEPPAQPSTEAQLENSDHNAGPAANDTPKVSNDQSVVSPQPQPHRSVGPSSPNRPTALHDEPAAMYLMNMVESPTATTKVPPVAEQSGAKPDESRLAATTKRAGKSPSPERPPIITSFDHKDPTRTAGAAGEALGRKPSGARAPPPKKGSSHSSRGLDTIDDAPTDATRSADVPQDGQPQKARMPSTATNASIAEDAANFLAYADQPSPVKQPAPLPTAVSPPPPKAKEDELRSSFAPSQAAAERRAKAQQAAMDQLTARTVPGGGKRTAATEKQAWSESEDEDEPEPDEEHSPVVDRREVSQGQPFASAPGAYQPDVRRGMSQTRALPPVPRGNGEDSSNRESQFAQRDFDRTDQDPRQYSGFSAGPDRPRSRSPAAPHRQSRQTLAAPIQPPAQRQNVWNANFSADHGMDQTKSGKFVDLEEPNAQLTKAFAPHGLLQAGMQDKEDRSAKRQEELAKETGSSLINVPSKPPPPQTGLLGAVAAHERDRKNAGGIGATLTDREREKRLAEERSREIERLQRQQMEHMSKFGGDPNMGQQQGMYGQYGYGMPPPMGMMGMPPMGFNPYQGNYNQGGYNPYAQQQAMMAAQMAYQQAMMSMSHAGSQAGPPSHGHQSPDRPSSPASMQGHGGGMSPSPSMSPYGNYFPPAQQGGFMPPWGNMGNMGHMGMPWSASPGPSMGQGSWLQPPGMMGGGPMSGGGGSDDGRDSRSRVHSMISDSGQQGQQHQHQQGGPVN